MGHLICVCVCLCEITESEMAGCLVPKVVDVVFETHGWQFKWPSDLLIGVNIPPLSLVSLRTQWVSVVAVISVVYSSDWLTGRQGCLCGCMAVYTRG